MVHLDSKIPHQLAQEQALSRIREIISGLRDKYNNIINNVSQEWIGYDGRFSFSIKGLTINGKSMREHLEAINHAEAIDYITDLVKNKIPFNERTLLELHSLVLRGIDKENAGRYRNIQVRIGGSTYLPPAPYILHKEMEDYFLFYQANQKKMHPIVLAADMHEKLVTIHPFIDGNGRTSRLVMNLIALQNGYPIINVSGEKMNRMDYYNALEQVQVHNNNKAFRLLIANYAKASLNEWIKLCS